MEIENYEEILGRMKEASGTKNTSALAAVLDITPQTLSNHKKGGNMPANLVIKIAERYDCSLDWLFTGWGELLGVNEGERILTKDDLDSMPKGIEYMDWLFSLRAVGLDIKKVILEPFDEDKEAARLDQKQRDIMDKEMKRIAKLREESTGVPTETPSEPEEQKNSKESLSTVPANADTDDGVSEDSAPNDEGTEPTEDSVH